VPKENDCLGCKALSQNRIRIFIVKRGKEVASIDLPGKHVGKVVWGDDHGCTKVGANASQ